ncbi:MAG: segregation/condensation protein A, partial [Bacteroidota bacterium]
MSEVALDNTSFAIKTPVFEGPLELLLDLVEKRKLLINDISLAEVTDEYMTQVSEMQAASLPGTAHFVALAATLLLIKSKSLLPVLELTNEEEQAIEDLGERLRLYQIYRVAGAEIADLFGAAYLHERQYKPHTEPLFLPDQYCTKQMLAEAMQGVLANLPKTEQRPKVRVRKSVSLEDMMSRLQERIEAQMRIT